MDVGHLQNDLAGQVFEIATETADIVEGEIATGSSPQIVHLTKT